MRSATDTAGLTALVVITTDYLRTPGQDLDSFPDGYVSLFPERKEEFPNSCIQYYLGLSEIA